ncbi:MAG: RNA-binding S4 domain-containing protein [Erysipelotrichaceae bacterium]|nr:RNA-binding S4 domain-containing protein [Erysipelotrichaceae bacterium]
MRIDKWLKVSRLIKRRETAKELCDDGDVLVNGKQAKPMTEVKAGDRLILQMGKHKITLLVSSVLPYARKDEAKGMYEIIEDEIVERPIANPS